MTIGTSGWSHKPPRTKSEQFRTFSRSEIFGPAAPAAYKAIGPDGPRHSEHTCVRKCSEMFGMTRLAGFVDHYRLYTATTMGIAVRLGTDTGKGDG